MPKCDLSIELDEPGKIYSGGDKISGTVHVMADANVKCKGLEIATNWRTHGRGNVAQGTGQSVTVFSGEWAAGQSESYRFELDVPFWPPSYHGSYINIDHYVDVRAKIPWAFDPKATRDYVMRPTSVPDASLTTEQPTAGCVGKFLGFAIAGVMLVVCSGMLGALVTNPLVAVVIGVVATPIFLFVGAKFYLPKYLLGDVESELLNDHIHPGGTIRAKLGFQPKRRTMINAITATLKGAEVCVSGSGSNRTTHRNTFFDELQTLEGQTVLEAGVRKDFDLEFQVPPDVPYSFDLDDNDLNWEIALRVDIPRWPDWTKSLKLFIVPGGSAAADAPAPDPQATAAPAAPTGGDITFAETAGHLWEFRDDEEQVDILVDAVLGMTFDIDTFVERRLLYSGQEDPHVYKDGYAVWAHHSEPPLPLVLYVPHDLADEFEQAGRDLWRCRGTIVGWDHDHGRLQIKVLPNASPT